MNPIDILTQVEGVRRDLIEEQKRNWTEIEKHIRAENAELGEQMNLSPQVQEALLQMAKCMWDKGYQDGAGAMILRMVKMLGMEGVLAEAVSGYQKIKTDHVKLN